MVSHDRRFLETLSRTTVWLDRGETGGWSRASPASRRWRDEIFAQEELERHKLDRRIAREDQWMHGGVTARRKRNVRRVRELAAAAPAAQGGAQRGRHVGLAAADGTLSGRLVIEAEGVAKAYGTTVLVQGFATRILRGDRVGIVGPNGAGKTTLLNLLTGATRPTPATCASAPTCRW